MKPEPTGAALRSEDPFRRAVASACLLALLSFLGGCEREPAPDEVPAVELPPPPDLGDVSDRVRGELRAKRAQVEALLEDEGPDRDALVDAWMDLGVAYVVYDLLEPAEQAFEGARTTDPERIEPLYLIAYLHRIQGQLDEAVAGYSRVLELEPEFSPALLRLIRVHLERADTEAAEPLIERALEQRPDSAAAWDARAQLEALRGRDREAVEAWEKVLELRPDATSIYHGLGAAWRRLGDDERAARLLERAGDAPVLIEDSLLQELIERARSAEFYRQEGAEAIQRERWSEAVSAYEEAIALDPAPLLSYAGLAIAREQIGDRAGAVTALEQGLERATDAPAEDRARAWAHLGHLLGLLGRDDRAVRAFESSLELVPDQIEVRTGLADARARSGDFAGALELLEALIEAAPEPDPQLLARRGLVLLGLGRGDDAVDSLRRALEIDPERPKLHLQLATILERLGRNEEAKAARDRARELASTGEDAAGLALVEGRRLEAAGKFEEALAVYERASRAAPDHAGLLLRRGNVLGHLGRLEDARQVLADAVAAAPEAREPRRNEIVSLILLERYGEARVRLNEALRRFPLDLDLGRISARLLAAAPDPAVRAPELALRQAEAIYRNSPDPLSAEILAMARAAAGDAAGAREKQQEVVRAVQSGGELSLLAPARERLLLYERGEAFVASGPREILSSPLEAGLRPSGS